MEIKYKRVDYQNKYFRENLKYLLNKYKITKTELEKGLDIGDGSLSRYCRIDGAPEPKISMFSSIANVFGVTVDELININLEKKDVNVIESNERKEILFCKKLISETGENLFDWEALNFYNHCFIETATYEDYSIRSNWLESNSKFRSKFTDLEYDPEELSAFTTTIYCNVQIVIIQFIDYTEQDYIERYELYLIKDDGKVIPSCTSHELIDFKGTLQCDNQIDNILKELHNLAKNYCYYGKDNLEKEKIYDNYLFEVPF
ncbi:MAG: helix-turn-helix domain-containing protein [Paraclostridium sp.]